MPWDRQKSRNFSAPPEDSRTAGPFHTHRPRTGGLSAAAMRIADIPMRAARQRIVRKARVAATKGIVDLLRGRSVIALGMVASSRASVLGRLRGWSQTVPIESNRNELLERVAKQREAPAKECDPRRLVSPSHP